MVPCVVKWKDGYPSEFKAGQFIVYKDGDCELIGWDCRTSCSQEIVKHTTLIEPHELDWLQSMAVKRCLGELK
jgi:hypothetical protein